MPTPTVAERDTRPKSNTWRRQKQREADARLAELLRQPYLRNRVAELLEARGIIKISTAKRDELGFNHKTWAAMLKDQHVLTAGQVKALQQFFGLADPGDLFHPLIDVRA